MNTKDTGQLQEVAKTEDVMIKRGCLYRIGDPIKQCENLSPLTDKDAEELMEKLEAIEAVDNVWRSGPEIWVDAIENFEIPVPDRFAGDEA